ncbi:MAG: CsgG/HfaB family protein [Caulobacter sp.]|nr:CsgG/HfaB family protein [Caulobacter sp.]
MYSGLGIGKIQGVALRSFFVCLGVALMLALPGASLAQARKPVVAIYKMEDLTRSGQEQTLSTMIETAISATSKFRVMERSRLGTLVGEQGRAKAGLITTDTPGRVGGFEGADFLIYGTITTLSSVAKSDLGSSLAAGLFAQPGTSTPSCNVTVATLSIDIKITDAKTGEVRYVSRIDETQKSAARCGGAGQIDSSALLRAAADNIAGKLVTAIYPIQVAAVQSDGTVVLNYGEGTVAVGAVLAAYSKGEAIKDPATGEVLSYNEEKLGFLRVTEVTGRVSRAMPASAFAVPLAVGSIVRPATQADVNALSKPSRRR